MLKKVIYSIIILHMMFQVIYMTLGQHATSDLGALKYLFYVFRPEYLLVSGIVSFFITIVLIIIIIKSIKSFCFIDLTMLLLNVEYIIYYLTFLARQ